jgi:DNA-directed RNA polymerase specialized sigma24 family protein
MIHKIAWSQASKNARNHHEFDDHYQDISLRLYEELPRHEPHRGNLEGYLRFHATMSNKKTLDWALSASRDHQQRYRKLIGTEVTYDSFMHAAEAKGAERFDATVVWLNAGPTDYYEPKYYEASFADVDSNFFNDKLAISGSYVEEQVINADTLSEIMAIFAEECDPRVHQVWTLVNQLDHYTYEEIGQLLDPPISKATVSRDFKKAEAALYALGQVYQQQQDENRNSA